MEKKKKISLIVFIIGLFMLVFGLVFLIVKLVNRPGMADGEYLISAESWTLSDDSRVIWDFTEIGKGTLTTNDHLNDYDFTWEISDGKLIINTEWLYEMNNEFEYELNQKDKTLIIKDGDEEKKFEANFENS